MITQIESIVGEHFNVSIEQIRDKGHKRDAVDARHFVWYILYYVIGYSGQMIADIYDVSARNVFYTVDIIKQGIRNQAFYANHYRSIQKRLKELDII